MHRPLLRYLTAGLACCLLVLGPAVQAGEWFELGGFGSDASADAPADTLLETDLQALHVQGAQRSLVLRLSFRPPRQNKTHTYRSIQARLTLSCESDHAAWKEVRFFSDERGEGTLLGIQDHGAGLAVNQTDWLPASGWSLLRKSACAPAAMKVY